MTLIRLIPPGLVVAAFLVLILSATFYATLQYRRRAYVPILVMTATGVGLGQLWDFLGLPSLRLGQANLLPAVGFALVLQLLVRYVPRFQRQPKEPRPASAGNPPTDS